MVVDLNVGHGYGMNPDAETREPTSYGTLQVTLDGSEPVDRRRLEREDFWTRGRVVFEVKQGTAPKSLRLRQVYTFDGNIGKVTMIRELKLRPTR
ncbi:MAG TPA: hypothetical protein VIR30_15015 [Nocardioides sp.]